MCVQQKQAELEMTQLQRHEQEEKLRRERIAALEKQRQDIQLKQTKVYYITYSINYTILHTLRRHIYTFLIYTYHAYTI